MAHFTKPLKQLLARHHIPHMHQPAYSPDMVPCDFSLFHKIKNTLKDILFKDLQIKYLNAMPQLLKISKTEYERCYQQWKS
jgi:hypothetical protein